MSRHTWRDIDFRPAPTGWRVWFVSEDNAWQRPVAGWLIQERAIYDEYDDDPTPDYGTDVADRPRRVATATYEESILLAFEDDPNGYAVIAPGESDPTADDIAEQTAVQRAAGERRRAKAKAS